MLSDEKREVLNLLESGKISAEEAAALLREMSTPKTSAVETLKVVEKEDAELVAAVTEPSTFRVRVRNLETGTNKVTVNIPMKMFKVGLQLGSRFSPELDGLKLDDLGDMMNGLEGGLLVEIQDEERNEQVQVYVE